MSRVETLRRMGLDWAADLIESLMMATYLDDNRDKLAGSVELALSREIDRLRRLADKVAVPEEEEAEQ